MTLEEKIRSWHSLRLMEYEGHVFDHDPATLRKYLRKTKAPLNSPDFWGWQSFITHFHPDEEGEDEIDMINGVLEQWRRQMAEQMPHRSFVIQIDDVMSWYELMPGAPTEDDEWHVSVPRPKDLTYEEIRAVDCGIGGFIAIRKARAEKLASHNPRACPKCDVEAGFTEPRVDERHRGYMWKTCLHCNERILHAGRVIREVVWATK